MYEKKSKQLLRIIKSSHFVSYGVTITAVLKICRNSSAFFFAQNFEELHLKELHWIYTE